MGKQKEKEIFDRIQLVHSGEDYFNRLIGIINKALVEIHLQTYILEEDNIGLEVCEALIAAAKRGVVVHVLVDGFGSLSLSDRFIKKLKEEGILFRFFSPWHSINNLYIGRRLHHKIVVVDSKKALAGGINISDKYRGMNKEIPWLDYALFIQDSEVCFHLHQLCRNIYFRKNRMHLGMKLSGKNNSNDSDLQILRNDWLRRKNEIHRAYLNAIRKSTHEIVIIGGYFFPGKKLIRELQKAAQRNVTIKIVLSGISDVPMIMRSSRYLYSYLLKYGIEIYEWDKSVLHGKVGLVDSTWATIGSFNLNNLSSFASIELNIGIKSNQFCQILKLHLDEVINSCEKITPGSNILKTGTLSRMKDWLAYYTVRFIFIIVTYIPSKRLFKFYGPDAM